MTNSFKLLLENELGAKITIFLSRDAKEKGEIIAVYEDFLMIKSEKGKCFYVSYRHIVAFQVNHG